MKSEVRSGASRMSDIARMAGVSVMTIHRALHGHPDISSDTKKRIMELAKKHNYRPNSHARAIRSGRFGSVGLATGPADLEMASVVGISRILNREGMNLVFAEVPYEREKFESWSVPRLFMESMVDGLIMHAGIIRASGMPQFLDSPPVPSVWIMGDGSVNCVRQDFRSVLPGAFNEALERGYESLVYLGPTEAKYHHYADGIWRSFAEWSRGSGRRHLSVQTDIRIPPGEWTAKTIRIMRGARRRLAFVAPSFHEARRCHALALECGRRVPQDIGIIAFTTRDESCDSGTVFSGYKYSSLSLGEEAAKLLMLRLSKEGRDVPSATVKFTKIEGGTLS